MIKKKVIAYARISNEDQSHFSIEGQQEEFEEYCFKKDYELKYIFTDEGQSAKDFERKEWKELEKYLKLNYREIDYLLVMKYDRFSRNVQQALNVITQLEEEYNIKILSIAEPIGLPPESPFYFQLRTQMLLQAHVERLIIKDRTIFGMQKAKKDGRYLGLAPYGYKNGRDSEKKPILQLVPHEVDIIQKMFNWCIEGYTFAEIRRLAEPLGFNKKGKDAIFRVLSRKIYVGLVHVPATKEEPEKYIHGVHEPIIDQNTFYKVQSLITRPEQQKRQYNELAYLKSVILCPECFKPMTCGKSKGKNKYYWYYECTTHRKSFNLDTAHRKFSEILKEVSFSDSQIQYLKEQVKQKLERRQKDNSELVPDLKIRMAALRHKTDNLEEKYILGSINDEIYAKWKNKFNKESQQIESQIKSAQRKKIEYNKAFYETFENLSNISYIFDNLDVQQKKLFIEKGFGKQVVYDGSVYRTPFLNPLFLPKSLILSNKELLKYNKKTSHFENDPLRVKDGSRTRDLRNHNPTL